MLTSFTPRELRIVADHVERVTKARVVNTQLGVEATPDVLTVRFPNGIVGTLHWTPGRRGATAAQQRGISTAARHRAGYTVDPVSLKWDEAPARIVTINGQDVTGDLADPRQADPYTALSRAADPLVPRDLAAGQIIRRTPRNGGSGVA